MPAPKFTEPVRERFIEILEQGVFPFAAAEVVGVHYRTVERARAADPVFKERMDQARYVASEPIEMVLYQAAERGEPWAVKMWLESHRRSTYSLKQQIEVEHKHTVEIDAGNALEEIESLTARLQEREQVAIEAGMETLEDSNIYDAEVIEDED